MYEIKIFSNEQFGQMRTIIRDGEPWFIAADVCAALELGNSRQALTRLDVDEKGVILTDTPGGKQEMATINEPGLYRLVMGSRKPEANAFKRWIAHEVIPSIRKHGMYATPETIENILQDPDNAIKLLQTLKEERLARQKAEEKIAADAPKVLFSDSVSQAKTEILIGELAKLLKQNGLDIGQNRLYEQLRKDKLIMYNSTIPTQYAMDRGLFRVIERTIVQGGVTHIVKTTKVTGKGQIYLINKYLGNKEIEI